VKCGEPEGGATDVRSAQGMDGVEIIRTAGKQTLQIRVQRCGVVCGDKQDALSDPPTTQVPVRVLAVGWETYCGLWGS